MRYLLRSIVAALVICGAWNTYTFVSWLDDGSETNFGFVTGPIILAAIFAAAALMVGGILALFAERASRISIVSGWLLALPCAVWMLLPPTWCLTCGGYSQNFSPGPMLATIALPPIALIVHWRAYRA